MTSLDTRRAVGHSTASPLARRAHRPSWRDPRLVTGVVLVAVSVLVGARLLASSDDTVPVWTVRHGLAAGQPVTAADLVASRVHFESTAAAEQYLPGDVPLPEGAVAGRPVGAGELLPRAAVSVDGREALVHLPLEVSLAGLPRGTGPGRIVDVWVTPAPDAGDTAQDSSTRVLEGVPVVSVGRAGAGDVRQVLVGLAPGQAAGLSQIVTALARGEVLLVLRADAP